MRPRLSVGMPVFNGADYVREAIESILGQTFEDFELIISDNGSHDGTEEICRAYAAQDRRVFYHRGRTNQGAARNFNRVFALSSGEYFKWAAHDDKLAPDFVSQCLEVLERDPSVVLCHTKTTEIDERGAAVSNYDRTLDLTAAKPHVRFCRFLQLSAHRCFEAFGVIRARALQQSSLIGSFPGSDIRLLAELTLFGKFYEVPEYLFLRRKQYRRPFEGALPKRHMRTPWFDTAKGGKITLPMLQAFLGYLASIMRAPVAWDERGHCFVEVLRWMWRRKRSVVEDLMVAARQLQGRLPRA